MGVCRLFPREGKIYQGGVGWGKNIKCFIDLGMRNLLIISLPCLKTDKILFFSKICLKTYSFWQLPPLFRTPNVLGILIIVSNAGVHNTNFMANQKGHV
jgi:hypothetical protein